MLGTKVETKGVKSDCEKMSPPKLLVHFGLVFHQMIDKTNVITIVRSRFVKSFVFSGEFSVTKKIYSSPIKLSLCFH